MKRISIICALFVATAGLGAEPNTPSTPAEQFQALLKEDEIATGSGVPLTDAERLKFIGRVFQHHYEVATKFLALAEKYPQDPTAADALIRAVWQVNTTPWPVEIVAQDKARSRAFELLSRDHCASEKLGPLIERISHGFCEEYEPFLRDVLAKNPKKEVQALACLSLARLLHHRFERVDLCREEPDLAKEFADLFGKEYLAGLTARNREEATQEIEALFERAAEEYPDIELPGGETVAERAKSELFTIRNLSVGREAPEIEGEDQDGFPFRLNDYRGKAVLLDFWSYV